MPTISEIRTQTDEIATCAIAVLFEGIPYIFVTDHPGNVLHGSGASSWIGQYESDPSYTDHETVGQRQVIGGLIRPATIRKGSLNPNTGMLETTQLTIELMDVEGILPTLFAPEGKDEVTGVGFTPVLLGERVAPGTTAVTSTLSVGNPGSGSVTTIDPANMYLGVERLGPARERRWFYPFPTQGIGLHHHVHAEAQNDDGPPRVQVSEQPIVWAGRQVAIYRLYRDPSGDPDSYTSWPHLGTQYAAGALEWWGVMQDRGEYDGTKWRIQCFGPESLLRRRMNTIDLFGKLPISDATTVISTEEQQIAVGFQYYQAGGAIGTTTLDSIGFGTVSLSSSGTRESYAAEIAAIVSDVADGTTPGDFGSGTTFNAEDFGSGDGCQVAWEPAQVRIRRSDQTGGGVTDADVWMTVCMHAKVWRLHGYDPELQHSSLPQNEFEIEFRKLDPDDKYMYSLSGANSDAAIPNADGFWSGRFRTLAVAADNLDVDAYDNRGGGFRRYRAMFQFSPLVLTRETDQPITLGVSWPYLEGDPTVASGTFDRGRWCTIEGKRAVGTTDDGQVFDEDGKLVEDVEAEDEAQPVEVYWNEGTGYGTIDDSGAGPELVIHKWKHPHWFGIDRDKISGEWAALAAGEYGVWLRPLSGYLYREDEDVGAIEKSWAVLAQLLLSTGTAGGWQGDNTYDPGVNAPPTATGSVFWANDITGSELGLGIPYVLVQDPAEMRAAFDLVHGGADGGLNKVRHVFSEPFESTSLIEELLRPRWLAMTLRGGRYSVTRLVVDDPADVEHSITEASIAVSLQNPATVAPIQTLRPTGAIDGFTLNYRRDPTTSEQLREWKFSARDPSARLRRGDVEEELTDGGLIPPEWASFEWLEHFRQTQAHERATWQAKRHYTVKTRLNRIAGQDVWPGDRVSFTSRRVYSNLGALGVTDALGVVTDVTWRIDQQYGDHYEVEILIYADQDGIRLWSPIAKVAGPYTGGDTIPLEADADFIGHGEGDDGTRFLPPSWSSVSGQAEVCILEYDRSTWTLHSADTQSVRVASTNATQVGLDGAFATTFHAWTDKWVVMAPWSSQASDGWVRAHLLPVLQDDLTHSGGEAGIPFVDG